MQDQFDELFSVEVEELEETNALPGVIGALGKLTPNSIVSEEGAANMFGRHLVSIKRAVKRGELPPPTKLFGSKVWTVGALVKHIENRLE